MAVGDAAFVGEIPLIYEQLLVPLVFAEPAPRLAAAVLATNPTEILETAAGTGVLTRALVDEGTARVTATDLNQPMLDEAARLCSASRVQWQQADALALPFADESFDAVTCQFGVMFFPDRPKGYAEAQRVLRPGGRFFFNVWDAIESCPTWRAASDALDDATPEEPLGFLRRAPFGYFDVRAIRADLEAGGFQDVRITNHTAMSHSTAAQTAVAICQGTPLRNAIEAHSRWSVEAATETVTRALRDEFGSGALDAPISWLQVDAGRVA